MCQAYSRIVRWSTHWGNSRINVLSLFLILSFVHRRPACAGIPYTDTGADVVYAGLVMQPSLHSKRLRSHQKGRGRGKREIVVIIFTVWNSKEASISNIIYMELSRKKKKCQHFYVSAKNVPETFLSATVYRLKSMPVMFRIYMGCQSLAGDQMYLTLNCSQVLHHLSQPATPLLPGIWYSVCCSQACLIQMTSLSAFPLQSESRHADMTDSAHPSSAWDWELRDSCWTRQVF